ncbi:tetratricopeptide repeat protein, partial [Kordiimonas sp.]|uniref:tetratricopeptide repeat protein n=1 Tax=Kordiimonas sp. TaxID=1970157 RepID=UPI003A8E19BE
MVDITATIKAGLAALGKKDLARAEALFAGVLAAHPGEANALHFMGAVRQLEGQAGEAESYFRAAVRAAPDEAPVHNSLGNLLNQQGRTKEALACFEAALSLAPGLQAAQMNAAIMQQKLGQHEA